MKKLFLTSGLVLCMACPAFASQIDYAADGNPAYTLNGNTQLNLATSGCVEPPLTSDTETTFYALWEAKDYTVTYKPGSVVESSTDVTFADETEATDQPTNVTFDGPYTIYANTAAGLGNQTGMKYYVKEGYNFAGWKSEYNLANGQETETTYTGTSNQTINPYKVSAGNVDLVAQWTAKQYNVTYVPGAHALLSGSATSANVTRNNAITFDTTYMTEAFGTAAANANGQPGIGWTVADGYSFEGWGTTANTAPGSTIQASETVGAAMSSAWTTDDNLTLYAIYSANPYTLSYNCGGFPNANPAADRTASVTTGGALASTTTFSFSFDSVSGPAEIDPDAACALEGYHATGWTCNVVATQTTPADYALLGAIDYDKVVGDSWAIAGNVECKAVWAANEIELTWEPGHGATAQNGGTYAAGEGTESCTYDLGINVGAAPKRAGYDFVGWTTDENDSRISHAPVVNNNDSGGGDNNGETPTGEEPEQTEP